MVGSGALLLDRAEPLTSLARRPFHRARVDIFSLKPLQTCRFLKEADLS
jgi:hypothetical protein